MTHALYTSSPTGFGPTISQHRDNASAFYHPDHLGTVWNLTNAAGSVTDTYLFDAWGNQLASTGSTVNPFRYVGALGYYAEPSTALTYVRARWLRPATGSWVSVDPVRGEGRYCVVSGRPLRALDPSGTYRTEDEAIYRYARSVIGKVWGESDCIYLFLRGTIRAGLNYWTLMPREWKENVAGQEDYPHEPPDHYVLPGEKPPEAPYQGFAAWVMNVLTYMAHKGLLVPCERVRRGYLVTW
jgi:RHS repeat-associated protein